MKKIKIEEEIFSPCLGKIIDITETSDDIISQKLIGDGMAIIPKSNYVCAPISGDICSIFPTNHAFQMKTETGIDILVHIGVDTVELNGKYLKRLVEEKQKVIRGTPIIKANFAMIELRKFDPTVIIILLENKISEKTTLSQCEDINTVLFKVYQLGI